MPPKTTRLADASIEEFFREWQRRLEEQRGQHGQREEDLRAREAAVAAREEALEEATTKLMGMLGESTDVVEVNAGGQVHAVSRGTLCMVEGSLLASLFSGRWEDKMQRDSVGRPFLDVDRDVFDAVVGYLRLARIAGPGDHVPPPEVEPRKGKALQTVLRYYGLEGFVASKTPFVITSFSGGRSGECLTFSASPRFGYRVKFVHRFRLTAVYVGLDRDPGNAKVIVGVPPTNILGEWPLTRIGPAQHCPDEPECTHVADGLDILLHPPECFIMVSGSFTIKYWRLGEQEHARGSFIVKSANGLPSSSDSGCMCMAIRSVAE